MSETQLATKPTNDLRVMIQSDKMREQLVMALPKYYSPEQFTVIVRTAINKNPNLAECEPGSFMVAMLQAAQMGILPNGRDGHLIPRWSKKNNRQECTFQADYKGLVGLVRKNDNVVDVYADTVCEFDFFKLTKGLHRDIVHEVDITKPRGEIVGVYAVVQYKDGTNSWDFMSRDEVENVRSRSDSWKAHLSKGYDTPWKSDEGEMFKKTIIKRLLKLADLSQETADRIAIDNDLSGALAPQVEIKRATVEQQALPARTEPLPKPQPEPNPEPETKPVAKPEKKTPKAKDPELKQAAAKVVEPTPDKTKAEQIREKLRAIGKEEGDLLKICEREKWIKPGAGLESLTDKTLSGLLEFWGEIDEELNPQVDQTPEPA